MLDKATKTSCPCAAAKPANAVEPGRRLGAFLASYLATALPQDVVTAAKLFILDTLGVMAAGTTAVGIQELARAVRAMEPSGGIATVLIGGFSASPTSAALINAAAAHALDFDDTHDAARVHAFSIVLPAALAATELRGSVDGRALLTAVALGSEVFCRLGLTGFNTLARGWHPTTGYGSIAAAVTAARILDLSAEQVTNALGLAYVQMSGTTQSIIDGALSKRLGPGIAARNGLLAAQLARFDFTGPWRFLEGDAGLFHLHLRDEVRPEFMTENLGHVWHMLDLSMKPFPCCRCSHALIQIGIELNRQGLMPQQIKSGRLLLGAVNHGIVGAAYDPGHANPVVHAQFNATYAFCRALIDGMVGVSTFSPDGINGLADALPQRIRCEIADDLPADALAPARVELTLADGSSLTMSRDTMKGAPDDPMTLGEILAKFNANMEWGLRAQKERADAVSRLVLSLETVEDARMLMQTFRAAGAG